MSDPNQPAYPPQSTQGPGGQPESGWYPVDPSDQRNPSGPGEPYPGYANPQYANTEYASPQYGNAQYGNAQYPGTQSSQVSPEQASPGQQYPGQQYPDQYVQPESLAPTYPGYSPSGSAPDRAFVYPPMNPVHAASGPAPSKVTAVIAIIMALLGVVSCLVLLVSVGVDTLPDDKYGRAIEESDSYQTEVVVAYGYGTIALLLLLVGAILLMMRQNPGRFLILAGAAVYVIGRLLELYFVSQISGELDSLGSEVQDLLDETFQDARGIALAALIFPVLTALFAMLPATARWVAPRPESTSR